MANSLVSNLKTKLNVVIKDRQKTLYEGQVSVISSYNDNGPFDILPQHANFITLIKKSLVIDASLPTRKEIKVDKGVLSAYKDNVIIYLGIGTSEEKDTKKPTIKAATPAK